MKATRKITKGGLPNVLFVQAAIENLPEELDEPPTRFTFIFRGAVCFAPSFRAMKNSRGSAPNLCAGMFA